ncbi:unnamed protein product [Parnassius apollo]|uniref:(apollo) hypothetical protein n=1 Tax=Parnassius apollo TaxID=110799 RepID=A0A8S3XDZ3_PARAO|nr:unnamed protein product [Parnassius apollo]
MRTKKKKRENYHAKKRLIKDLNPKERYNARVIWRLRKKTQRERARNLNRVLDVKPPSSPRLQEDNLQNNVVQNKNDDIDREQNLCASPTVSEASKRGRKKVKRDRSKIYRENIILRKENQKLKQKYEKYKKKLQRTTKTLEKKEKKTTEKEKYETLITWNFFEAGHGKGPADVIGGFLKRKADEIVAAGTDVPKAEKFFEVLKGKSKIQLYMVIQETIEATGEQLPKNIKPLQGTLQVHQIFTEICGELKYRTLGCFCNRSFCGCLQPKIYRPLKDSLHNILDMNVDEIDTDMSDSGSDNIPLSRLQHENEINVPDLFQPRKQTVYDLIYSPKDYDNEPDNDTNRFLWE